MTKYNGFEVDENLLRILRDPNFWNPPVLIEPEELASILDTVDADDERAAALCDKLLTGSSTTWRERFGAMPETRTPGMVRQLLERMPALRERRPADALEATSIAVAIAEMLDPLAHWPDYVHEVRGQALREHASALSFLGRHGDALTFVELAERTFAQILANTFDLARLAVVKASVIWMLDRKSEAIGLMRNAAEMFLELGEDDRCAEARATEAAMLAAMEDPDHPHAACL